MPRIGRRQILGAHDLGALLVDDLALVVGDVVELQQLLADVEVVRLDLALRLLDLAREHAALDDLAFLHARHLQQRAWCGSGRRRCASGCLPSTGRSGSSPGRPGGRSGRAAGCRCGAIRGARCRRCAGRRPRAPCRGAPARRRARRSRVGVVGVPAALRARPRGCRRARCRCRGRPCWWRWSRLPGRPACATIVRLALVLLGIQHLVRDALLLQQPGEKLGGLDRGRADQHRLLALDAVADVLDDRLELVLLRQVHEVRHVLADHRLVGRDHDHFEAVDLQELRRLGVRRAGHAGELRVQAEVVLEGDRGDRLVLLADPHAFLRLDRLVQAVGPAPARHGAAGELIDDDHLAAAHDVLDVALVERVRAQRRVEVMHQADVGRVVEALALAQQARLQHQLLDVLVARPR